MTKSRLIVALLVAIAVFAGSALAATFLLTKTAETTSTISFSWQPQTGADGYRFYAPGSDNGTSCSGTVVSRTFDPSRTTVRFAKVSSGTYCVEAIKIVAFGSAVYPEAAPPPPKPACSDGLDNDGDGKIDYPADPGCTSLADTDETDALPPPPSGTITPAQFQALAVAGATIQNVTVTGSVSINAANITVSGATVQGTITLNAQANSTRILNSNAVAFTAYGADNTQLVGDTFDGGPGKSCQNFIWPGSASDPSSGWLIQNSTFRNYQCSNPHSEALYIASSASRGYVVGNTFTNNGNTSHIFFTWCSPYGNGCVAYKQENAGPNNWCVTGNTFFDTWTAYYAINSREELENQPLNLKVDNHQTVTGPVIAPGAGGGSSLAQFAAPWSTWMLVSSCTDPR